MDQFKTVGEVVRGWSAINRVMDRIEYGAASIFVRDEVNGVMGNYLLSDLPAPRALHWAFEFLRRSAELLEEKEEDPL